MTTIKTMKLQCTSCSGRFYANLVGSFGFRGTDDNLCRKYWGFNPMLVFYAMCPHCKEIKFASDFIEIEDEPEEELPSSPETCEKFDLLAEQEIEGDNNPLTLAYLYHQSACCRKIQQEEYVDQLQKAKKYFKLAKQAGTNEFLNKSIDTWIDATLA